jgi:cholesterol oxidase
MLMLDYNSLAHVNAIGFGSRTPVGREPVGSCITGYIDCRDGQSFGGRRALVEDGSIPGALRPLLPLGLAVAALGRGRVADRELPPGERSHRFWHRVRGFLTSALRSTQVYLIMADDPTQGILRLDRDRLRIDWPVPLHPVYEAVRLGLQAADPHESGVALPDTLAAFTGRNGITTVHPLGGCPMGGSAETGVVDHTGAVFRGSNGKHPGLYVCDASVIPVPIGANPLLTITAIAERTCALMP